MNRRRGIFVAVVLLLVGAGAVAVGVTRGRVGSMAEAAGPVVPTARVQRGSLELTVHLTGDMRASRQTTIMAPAVGGALRVLKMSDPGDAVSEGEIILEFDPADQLYALEQAQSELLEAEQEIIKRKADTAAQEAQDKVALITEQSNLRRAELDASVQQDLIPANEFKIRQAALVEARRVLTQTEQDIQARGSVNKAGLSVLEEKRTKASFTADRARQNIESLVIKSPMNGVISVRENWDAAGGFVFWGMTMPPYRVGDTVNPGRQVVDVFDVSRMEVRAVVNEQDRANVENGQKVALTSNAAPGVSEEAKVLSVSGLGRPDRRSGPLRLFEVVLQIDDPDPALRPGTSVDLVTSGRKVDDLALLPRQAVFEREGKPVVYMRGPDGFDIRPVKVLHRTESRIAIEGVPDDAEVALVNPDTAGKTKSSAATPAAPPAPAPGGAR